MIENFLSKIISSSSSVIVFGNLGRYPSVLNYFLKSHLVLAGDSNDEPRWLKTHDDRNIYVWIEPPFGTKIPSIYQNLVFTSHLDLEWSRLTTKLVYYHIGRATNLSNSLNVVPYVKIPFLEIKPPIQQPFHIPTDFNYENFVVSFDGSDIHKIYLSILTFLDTWRLTHFETPHSWSIRLSLPERRKLELHLKRSRDNIEKFIGRCNKEIEERYLVLKTTNEFFD